MKLENVCGLEMKRDIKRAHLNTNFAFQEHVLLQK